MGKDMNRQDMDQKRKDMNYQQPGKERQGQLQKKY